MGHAGVAAEHAAGGPDERGELGDGARAAGEDGVAGEAGGVGRGLRERALGGAAGEEHRAPGVMLGARDLPPSARPASGAALAAPGWISVAPRAASKSAGSGGAGRSS